ncbi:MAG: hypothetical protein ACRD2B_13375 [Terriglobia bacterium]
MMQPKIPGHFLCEPGRKSAGFGKHAVWAALLRAGGRELRLLLLCLVFATIGTVLGVSRARACQTVASYGSTGGLYRFGLCACGFDNQGQCVEVLCMNNGECGDRPDAVGCDDSPTCTVQCGFCAGPDNL